MAQIRCKKCGREVNIKEKYCPVCGNLIKKNVFARAVLFIIAVSIVFYIYPKLTNKMDEKTHVKYSAPAVSMTASRLYEIYEQSEPSADKKFKGKVVSVTGRCDGKTGRVILRKCVF